MKRMKNLSYCVVLIGFLLSACQENHSATPPTSSARPYPVVEVPTKTVTGYVTFPTSIEGTVNSAIRAKTPGYITHVLVDEGQAVKQGQPLFRLETQTLTEDAGAAQANVQAAQVEVDKLKPLVEKGIIGSAQLQTAQARLAQAKASYQSVTANIGYATLKSPINGYVGSIPFREGALVSPGDPTPLTTVSDTDSVYAYFGINERDYLKLLQTTEGNTLSEKIKNLPPVELRLVNGEIYKQPGTIQTVTGQVNEATGTVSVRAIFPNSGRLLANGNSGKIRIPNTYHDVPVVPETATYEQQGRVYVYQVRQDTAVSTAIGVKDRVNNLVVVASGLKAGDEIVADGVGKLRDNTPIQPQPVPFDSIAQPLKVVFK